MCQNYQLVNLSVYISSNRWRAFSKTKIPHKLFSPRKYL